MLNDDDAEHRSARAPFNIHHSTLNIQHLLLTQQTSGVTMRTAYGSGNRIVNVAPFPSSLTTLIEPLCASTIALAM
jgi:hypothetical protein